MKRLVLILLAVCGLAFAQVQPSLSPQPDPAAQMSCCGNDDSACDQPHSAKSPSCAEKPTAACPACLPCAPAACVAILAASDLSLPALSPVARLTSVSASGLQRSDPPLLTPPRNAT